MAPPSYWTWSCLQCVIKWSTLWITSFLKVFDLICLVSYYNSSCSYKVVEETRKSWPRKACLIHMLWPFLATLLAGTSGASWHWQVSTNSQQGSPWACLQSLWVSMKPQCRAHPFLCQGASLSCYFYTHRYTGELVKYKRKCVYQESKARSLSILTLSWRS